MLDINPHQQRVLPVELALAEGIIQRVGQPGSTFSVITFGSQTPTLLKSGVTADDAIAILREVIIERTREEYFTVRFYDALSLAMSQLVDDTRPKSLLVISEGNDYFPRKTFKESVVKAQQLHAACDVAMVADHSFYGTKGIQRYGFDLRRFAGKTRGRYIEVGGKLKNVPRSIEKLSEDILNQSRMRVLGKKFPSEGRLADAIWPGDDVEVHEDSYPIESQDSALLTVGFKC